MDIDNLVKMANQIGRFFAAWPDQEAAREEVTNHLVRFWDPRMRAALQNHLAQSGVNCRLSPLVTRAVARIKS